MRACCVQVDWAEQMSREETYGDFEAIQMYCAQFNRNAAIWIPGRDLPILCFNDGQAGRMMDHIVRRSIWHRFDLHAQTSMIP